jgi:hypothetical protein
MSNHTWNFAIALLNSNATTAPNTWGVNGSIPVNAVVGNIDISASLGASRTATFTVSLARLGVDPYTLVGRGIRITYTNSLGDSKVLFTGIIRSPQVSNKNRTVVFSCSDNFKDRLAVEKVTYPLSTGGTIDYNAPAIPSGATVSYGSPTYTALLQLAIDAGALYSPFVFGEIKTQKAQNLFEAYLSTTLKDYAVDGAGVVSLVDIDTTIGIGPKTYDSSNIVYSDEPVQSDISTPTWAPVNEIICTVQHRYPVLAQRNYRYTYSHPGVMGTRGTLQAGTNWATKSAFESAISASGLKPLSITYTDQPPTQVYSDGLGNDVFWITSEDIRKNFVETADFRLGRRFTYDVNHTLVTYVRCSQSYDKYGLISKTENASVDANFDTATWIKDFKAPTLSSNLGEHTQLKNDIAGYATSDANNAMAVLVARAKREILKANSKAGGGVGASHVFKTSMLNAPDKVGYRATISIPNLNATGMITQIDYSMGLDSAPIATVTVSSQNFPPASIPVTLPDAVSAISVPGSVSGSQANGGPYTRALPVYIAGLDAYPGDNVEGHFTNGTTPATGFSNEVRFLYNEVSEAHQAEYKAVTPTYLPFNITLDTLTL